MQIHAEQQMTVIWLMEPDHPAFAHTPAGLGKALEAQQLSKASVVQAGSAITSTCR